MLKHVSVSSLSFRNKCVNSSRANVSSDTISINSAISLTSSNSNGSSSGSISTPGTPDSADIESRSSSSTSIQDIGVQKIVVKVYARVLCADVEYKTLCIGLQTSSREVVRMLLNKFRMKHRDPNLFYLTMEVWIRKTGVPIRSVMVLDDDSYPGALQACYPHQCIKFSLVMRRGGLVKVYNSCLMSASLYKCVLLSDHTSVDELIQLILHCYNSKERHSLFALYEVCPSRKSERKLRKEELPLRIQKEWTIQDVYFFQLRRNREEIDEKKEEQTKRVQPTTTTTTTTTMTTRKTIPITRTVDSLGNVKYILNIKEDVRPELIHSPTLKPTYNDYENYFYI